MLRVDHAGEIAANTIYQAQAEVFRRLGDEKTSRMMEVSSLALFLCWVLKEGTQGSLPSLTAWSEADFQFSAL